MKTLSELGLTDDKSIVKYLQTHTCAECGGSLHLQLDYIHCIRDKNHSEFGKPFHKETDNEARINKIRRLSELSTEIGNEQTRAVQTLIGGAMTEKRAGEIIKAIWPTAPDIDRQKAAMLCASYGLNPLAKHVFLIPFKNTWALVMGISATRLIAQRQGDFSYLDDTPRIMTEAEQIKAFGEVDGKKIWAVCILKNVATGATAIGRGNWPKDTDPQGTDKGNTKANMAFIRAERQALDRLCPGKLPTNVEVMDESLIDIPDVGRVNTETGQIVDSEAKVLDPKPAPVQTPTSGAVNNSEDLGTCPIHPGVPLQQLHFTNSKRNLTGHVIEGELTKNNKPKYCTSDDVDKWRQTAEKQAAAAPAGQPPQDAVDLPPAAGEEEIDKQDTDSAGEGPSRDQINSLAQQLYGPEWQPKLRNFLKDNFGIASRNAIKEPDVPKITAKLYEMVQKMQ